MLAEAWGWAVRSRRIHACRPADEDDTPSELAAPVRAEALRGRLVPKIGPGHVLYGREPVVRTPCCAVRRATRSRQARGGWGVSPYTSHYAIRDRPCDLR
ncbi:hypothetical protein GCM10010272_24370 [Streptomyces lateritius]|nr:hypothetical protein GCM10010272_24370 [Streptomyces lateritius]